ncbi:MAG: class I SAM-dependent methyltransferase, partial [Chloroflexi bacterium]
YERSKWQPLHFDRVHRHAFDLAARFGDPAAVLDVGCGTGRLLRAAHERWPKARLVGVDPSEGMIEDGRRRTRAELHVAGAEAIPLPDHSIDLAFSTIAFHHWADPARGLREVARVLRPGGGLVIIDNIGPDWIARRLKDRPYLSASPLGAAGPTRCASRGSATCCGGSTSASFRMQTSPTPTRSWSRSAHRWVAMAGPTSSRSRPRQRRSGRAPGPARWCSCDRPCRSARAIACRAVPCTHSVSSPTPSSFAKGTPCVMRSSPTGSSPAVRLMRAPLWRSSTGASSIATVCRAI